MSDLVSDRFSSGARALAGSLAVAFALAGCGGPAVEPVNPQVYNTMHAKPVDSYTLLPRVTRSSEGQLQPTGTFNLVIKTAELKNAQAVNPEGQAGELTCSIYLTTRASLTNSGDLTVYYDNGGRYSRGHHYRVEPQGNQLRLPPSYEGSALYYAGYHQHCSFAPIKGAMP
jgi:hypothetical protein